MSQADTLTPQLTELCRLLADKQFGVGGSCLLWQLGLVEKPTDIDVVCTEADFAAISALLSKAGYQPQLITSDPKYATAKFSHFRHAEGRSVDLMAGIAVRKENTISRFAFHPERCRWQDGICWMPPADWLQIYQLFGRSERIAQLRQYLVQLRLGSLT
ncbi:hypothetical protein JAO78_006735 [Alishewanella sp. 16-MA]|uniref:Nucleotidyltransferase family protein n=1 Tax=Alishewanella maricola TaxID=2795740 RepID=A0ABS8C2G6_9ALTE|nr:hypothetical protein [Alishewanella maricola]MCB5226508.1 hypothetical protein [Alishewanella maricola]